MKLALALMLIPTITLAKPHTGELLYKLKSEYSNGLDDNKIQTFRPAAKAELENVRQRMIASDRYEFVEFNTIESTDIEAPADPQIASQWQHPKIQTHQAWDITQGSEDIVVAVCDSGVESNHEDLAGRVLQSGAWDFVDEDSVANPVTSHGTFVAGLIAAKAGNGLGVAGVAPNVKILPLRITNSNGQTTIKKITDCIRYAADQGARIINVSMTGIESQAVNDVGIYARARNALLVYSAGNQGKNRGRWPDYESVLAVGATTTKDTRWTYRKYIFLRGGSNYGHFIDIVAPGHNVYSTTTYIEHNNGSEKYRSGSGTSYSAPIVAGVAALVLSVNPELTPDEVEGILIDSADQIGNEYVFGAGRVNAQYAVELALETL